MGLPGGPAELVGVVPAGSAPAALDGQWLPAGMTLAEDADLAGLGLPAELAQRLPAASGSALLLDAAGALVWAGPGERLLRSAGPKPLTTDIDKSTWGKVKELFR